MSLRGLDPERTQGFGIYKIMLTYEKLQGAFDSLRLQGAPVIAHASLKSFGEIDGGAADFIACRS